MKTLAGIAGVVAVIVAAGCLVTCDSYNIVEPRFYSDSDITELSVCPPDKSDPAPPVQYAASVCWSDEANRALRINVLMPESRELKLSIVGSGGERAATLADGFSPAGIHRFYYDASVLEDGVYGIYAIAGDWQDAIWFEIE